MASRPLNDDEVLSEMNKMVDVAWIGSVYLTEPYYRSPSSNKKPWRRHERLKSKLMRNLLSKRYTDVAHCMASL